MLIYSPHLEPPCEQGKDAFVGLPQTPGQRLNEFLEERVAEVRMPIQEGHESVAVHHREFALLQRHHRGRTRLAVEQRQFPEHLTFGELAETGMQFALLVEIDVAHHPHAATQDQIDLAAMITFGEHGVIGGQAAGLPQHILTETGMFQQLIECTAHASSSLMNKRPAHYNGRAADKITSLSQGRRPIYEPGLDHLVQKNVQAGRLAFTTDIGEGVAHGLFQFIAVGTPPDEDGSADLSHVLSVARSIGEHMADYRVVVNKSTVPVGTADRVRAAVAAPLAERGAQLEVEVVSTPEFVKEGAAIDDFMRPDRIIVGTDNPRTTELLRALYAPFNRNHERVIAMDIRSAELTKYAANAMLATKISFMNELANLAERLGADIENVRIGIGADPRIGYHFIYPGCGYGGSCFPKDVKAL